MFASVISIHPALLMSPGEMKERPALCSLECYLCDLYSPSLNGKSMERCGGEGSCDAKCTSSLARDDYWIMSLSQSMKSIPLPS